MAELNGVPAALDQVKSLALTNFGHFTSMQVERQRVRGLALHLQRLARDCRKLFSTELDVGRVRDYVRHAVDGRHEPITARVTIYDPALDLGTIGEPAHPHVLVTTRPASTELPEPWRLQAVSYRRELPQVKHVGLFGTLHHRRAAQRDGFDDVLFVGPDGCVSEIATSNIGFVQGDQLVWPRAEYLSGITMTLLNQARDEPVITTPLSLGDLGRMDAAIATNAATGIRPIVSVDDTQWPATHPLLRELRSLYDDIPAEPL